MSGKPKERAGRAELRAALQKQRDKAKRKKSGGQTAALRQNNPSLSKATVVNGPGASQLRSQAIKAQAAGKRHKGKGGESAGSHSHRRGINGQVWYAQGDEGPIVEPVKPCVLVKAANASQGVAAALGAFGMMLKPFAISMKEERRRLSGPYARDPWRPFEDIVPFEQIAQSKGAGWIVHGSHSKKRPQNLTLMRFFSGHVLDMVEVGTPAANDNVLSSPVLPGGGGWATGNKPCFLFIGDEFETPESPLQRIGNMIVDLFGGHIADRISLRGLEHVICVTYVPPEIESYGNGSAGASASAARGGDGSSRRNPAAPGLICFRTYRVVLKKSGTRVPRIELEEMGPNIDWELRRTRFAARELYKEACFQPAAARDKKVKNVSTDSFAKVGRIHMQQQDIKTLAVKKPKALKRTFSNADGGDGGSVADREAAAVVDGRGHGAGAGAANDADFSSEFSAGGRKQKQLRRS